VRGPIGEFHVHVISLQRKVLEPEVLDSRPKLLGFHMPGLATPPHMPNKEAWGRQRKEIYCRAWDML
jgi:hypothetical protein